MYYKGGVKPLYLYFHLPYCHHKCPYCDFVTAVEARIPQEEYAQSLINELSAYHERSEFSDKFAASIYFGGGTPSLIDPRILRRVVFAVRGRFQLAEDIEVTLEANPNDLTTETLEGLLEAGVNRLSIGAQSFNPVTLKELGRTHTVEDVENGIREARSIGFRNISVDLIYGAPKQTLKDFESDLKLLSTLGLQHASLYSLTIEKGTEFYTRVGKRTLKLPKEDLVADMMDCANETMPKLGFDRYEVSNFSKPGFESKHNLAYWDGSDYLGLGVGAHSMLAVNQSLRARWANIANPKDYIAKIGEGVPVVAWSENVSGPELGFEYLMLGLRKVSGVSIAGFAELTGRSIYESYPGMVEVLEGSKFLEISGDELRLTLRGMSVADSVVQNFAV